MKRVLWFLITTFFIAVFGLSGCANPGLQDDNELETTISINITKESITSKTFDSYNDHNLNEPTEVVSQSEEFELITDIAEKWVEGTYTYKGNEFTGNYSFAEYGNSFHIDENSLKTEIGLNLSTISYDAAIAFIAADTEKLFVYFDEEDAKRQFDYMEGWVTNQLDYLTSLTISAGSTYFHNIENDDVALLVNYNVTFNDYEEGHYLWVSMTMYLNDNGEWRVRDIDYTG